MWCPKCSKSIQGCSVESLKQHMMSKPECIDVTYKGFSATDRAQLHEMRAWHHHQERQPVVHGDPQTIKASVQLCIDPNMTLLEVKDKIMEEICNGVMWLGNDRVPDLRMKVRDLIEPSQRQSHIWFSELDNYAMAARSSSSSSAVRRRSRSPKP